MTLKELFTSVSFSLKDKAGSRLAGSIIIAWTVWNWEALYLTFFVDIYSGSLDEYSNKLNYIKGKFFDPWNLWHPIWIGALITVVFPIASTITMFIPDYFAMLRNNFKNWINETRTWTNEQYLTILDQREEQKNKYLEANEEYDKLKNENLQLKGDKNKCDEAIKAKDSEIEALNREINELENKIKEITEEGEKFIFDSKKAPTPELPRYDDHEMPDKLNIKDHDYSIVIKPLIKETEHWRCGIQFSKELDKFLDRKERHGENFPLLHLEKNNDGPALKVSYYDNYGKNVSNITIIEKYSGEPVVIKLKSRNGKTILDVVNHKTDNSLLKSKYEIPGLYGKLFAWGDYKEYTKDNSPNKYKIEAKIKMENKK